MPRGKAKAGVLENLIEKGVKRSVKGAVRNLDLATAGEVKSLVAEVRALRKQLALLKKVKATRVRAGRKPTHKKCTVRGCNKAHYAKGLCASHYQKQRRDAKMGKTKTRRGRKKAVTRRGARRR